VKFGRVPPSPPLRQQEGADGPLHVHDSQWRQEWSSHFGIRNFEFEAGGDVCTFSLTSLCYSPVALTPAAVTFGRVPPSPPLRQQGVEGPLHVHDVTLSWSSHFGFRNFEFWSGRGVCVIFFNFLVLLPGRLNPFRREVWYGATISTPTPTGSRRAPTRTWRHTVMKQPFGFRNLEFWSGRGVCTFFNFVVLLPVALTPAAVKFGRVAPRHPYANRKEWTWCWSWNFRLFRRCFVRVPPRHQR